MVLPGHSDCVRALHALGAQVTPLSPYALPTRGPVRGSRAVIRGSRVGGRGSRERGQRSTVNGQRSTVNGRPVALWRNVPCDVWYAMRGVLQRMEWVAWCPPSLHAAV
eukprot:465425-Rhodomonas_salina.3